MLTLSKKIYLLQNIFCIFTISIILLFLSGCQLVPPDERTRYGDTKLMWAAKNGDIKTVKTLLEESSGINERHPATGETPLIYAAKKNHTNIVKLLKDNGADTSIRDNMGNSALDWASRNGSNDAIKIILDNDKELNASSLISAIYSGDLDTVKFLLGKGAPVNSYDSYGDTPYLAAIKAGNKKIISYILKQGGDIHATDKLGRSAILLASQTGSLGIVSDLIDQGSDVNSKSKDGYTALMYASVNAQAGTVQFLLDNGANPNLLDNKSNSAIYLAAARKQWFIVELLLDAGADLSIRPEEEVYKATHIIAPLYGIAGNYYLNKNNKEKATMYYLSSKKFYINLSKQYEQQLDDAETREMFSLIGRGLLVVAAFAVVQKNSESQAKQQSRLTALRNKPKSYSAYNSNASALYPKYYNLNQALSAGRIQKYNEWLIPDNEASQSIDKIKQKYKERSAWAFKKAKKIEQIISCLKMSNQENIKNCGK